MTPSSARAANYNKHITDQLEILLRRNEVGSDEASKWRALGYRKAISAIRRFPEKIKSVRHIEEAKLNGVGEKILSKIEQILRTGTCDAVKNKPEWEDSVFTFMRIHGVGPSIAREWYYKGYRTLDDVRADTKGLVSRQQKIGLKYFEDLAIRIPREEVTDAFETVSRVAKIVVPGIELHCMGSYRRGAVTSGDIDIILTHPNPPLNRGMHPLTAIVTQLTCTGFLIDDLHQGPYDTKYMGICRLSRPGSRARRLDLLWVPYDELGASLLYFTGSDIFNRSMRLLANKKGMSLSQHGLYANVIRHKGEKITEGTRIAGATEQEVFDILGIPYLCVDFFFTIFRTNGLLTF
ncbi:hypothetical protein BCR44DRAFT_410621 [Catenaria anguillulae PL171]|uniref:DNA polymerase n=1 Tax=Catenaria anguillulae PL171 TaxID=765915 RepID=A0A1Y2I5Q4_9FUNG|nr:hypothetical protein BCR44DRAFT_410621 [Catenaria anguillulae PL171]